jgi:hypothetical protein
MDFWIILGHRRLYFDREIEMGAALILFRRYSILASCLSLALLPWACSRHFNLPVSPQPPTAATPTPTVPLTYSPTPTPTFSPAASATAAQAIPDTATVTFTATITFSATPTATVTSTDTYAPGTFTPTPTPTYTWTPTKTATSTPMNTATLVPCSASTTFGDPNETAESYYGGDNLLLNQFNLFWQSNITQVSGVFLTAPSRPSTVYMAIYDESGGYPKNRVWSSGPFPIAAGSYNPVTLTGSPGLSVPPGNYWVGFWGGGDSGSYTVYAMDQTPGSGNLAVYSSLTSLPGILPAYSYPTDQQYNYSLTVSWTACHQPVVTPTFTPTTTPTPTSISTATPVGTIPTPTFTPTPTPT